MKSLIAIVAVAPGAATGNLCCVRGQGCTTGSSG